MTKILFGWDNEKFGKELGKMEVSFSKKEILKGW